MPKRKSTETPDSAPPKKNVNSSNHWAMGLTKAMVDPESIVKSDDLVTIIKDKYPKAEVHYLILPKENISNLKAVNKEHVPLLKHMKKCIKELVKEQHSDKKIKYGYHAEASMHQLHLHAISDDMNSPCVKTKKHWNSFNTDFFLKSKDVIESLENEGKVALPSKSTCKQLLETPLRCNKCDYIPKHMPDLKKHLLQHIK